MLKAKGNKLAKKVLNAIWGILTQSNNERISLKNPKFEKIKKTKKNIEIYADQGYATYSNNECPNRNVNINWLDVRKNIQRKSNN